MEGDGFLAFYAISNISRKDLFPTFLDFFGNFEKCPFTYWLNGRWFLQIVDRDSGNLYPIYIYIYKLWC